MNQFFFLAKEVSPLLALMVLGFVAGKKLKIDGAMIARLVIYTITPMVIFNGLMSVPLSVNDLLIPLIIFSLASSLSFLFYFIALKNVASPRKNILALSAGSGNCGYFGLPLVLFLYGDAAAMPGVLAVFGYVFFETTVGYYFVSRGRYDPKQSFVRLLKMPALYAFSLGVLLNFLDLRIQAPTWSASFRGAYTVLGMMMVGFGISKLKTLRLDLAFLLTTFSAKFILWPLCMAVLLMLPLGLSPVYKQVLWALALVPQAANSVAFAHEINAEPESMATSVFLSTVFALVYIPLMLLLTPFF